MAPLELEGDTLGQRHKHYNQLVKQAIEQNQSQINFDISYEENDIDNFIKIDVASNNKNLDFILRVLKCKDILYISRVIKKCTWMITDPQYAHIINPQYLETHLFPEMITEAQNKLLLQIRLHLKDENRVDEFYNYYKERNLKIALKWLPHCSLSIIEKTVESHANEIKSETLIKRLCRKSITVFEIFMRNYYCYKRDILKVTTFLLNTHTEKYLEIIEKCHFYDFPTLGPKAVRIIMNKCPQKILEKFEKYFKKIDLATFAKLMKIEDIKSFLVKQTENETVRNWLTFDKLKPFIQRMPKEGRFEFLKKVFIDKTSKEYVENYGEDCVEDYTEGYVKCCYTSNCEVPSNSSANIYRWYQFAPFQVAFPELKKLIRSESSPEERCAMMIVLLTCAGKNMQHIQTLLQYYHDKHINEPFKFKIKFINKVIIQTNTHRYDEKAWKVLTELFHCMEVYIESSNNVQTCVQCILVYKLIHKEEVPEIIEKKFEFNSLKYIQTKVNDEEKGQIFNYLHDILQKKVNNVIITNQANVDETITLLEKAFSLIQDWKKDILQFPWVLDKIKELIKIKQTKSLNMDLVSLYNKNKSWRRHMFQESILMNPCEETTLNVLKHKADLLLHHKKELDLLTSNDSLALKRFLNKLRIYWSSSLAAEIITSYESRFNQVKGQRAVISGLCIILPHAKLLEIIKKYAPTDSKINWSEADELLLSAQKNIARNMFLGRPQPSPDAILLYAKGNYLQFVLPSLNSILYNLSSAESRICIPKLLDAPVSLQKHGIRLAFEKLKTAEAKKIFTDIWKSSKNSSIRTVLFKHTFELLCREKQPSVINELWEVLSMFIDNLSVDENRIIYNILGKVKNVPESVKGDFCKKSYIYLKSLPAKANCKNILQKVLSDLPGITELLEEHFVAEIALDYIGNSFIKEKYEYQHEDFIRLISAYQLCVKDEESAVQRYQRVLTPLMTHSFRLWGTLLEGDYYIRKNFKSVLNQLSRDLIEIVIKKKMLIPVKVFEDILGQMETAIPLHENYKLLRYWKLTVAFVKALDAHKVHEMKVEDGNPSEGPKSPWSADNENWNKICLKVMPDFAIMCKEYVKEDIKVYYSSIHNLFSKATEKIYDYFNMSDESKLVMGKAMLENEDSVGIYLFVLELLPKYGLNDKEMEKMKEIRKILISHPSLEVKMLYYETFDKPEKGVEIDK